MQTYFPAFESCVREGHAASIMCSYNAVNGVPSCANGAIQNDIVRDQWGFGGFFVSGWACAFTCSFHSQNDKFIFVHTLHNYVGQ